MLKLLGRRTSINVQKVAWVLAEANLAHEQVEVGGVHKGNDTPQYRAMNPTGRVPTLIDSDLILWESNAICRYLVAQYGGPLACVDAANTARADMWMEWFQNSIYTAFIAMFYQTVRLREDERDEKVLADAMNTLAQGFAIAESALAGKSYLAGDSPSLADVPFGSCLFRYFDVDVARPDFPAITAYHDRLKARPAYETTVMVDYSSLRPIA